ncbi:hypothetical protein AB6C57_20175 [Vibrio splendidus]|uniref:hypothetical protein n=1 Tax=Vibrio splendidus TaxID=29497 RepID=UPI00036873EA|nr:hypothetical protein [Vibrio splendidus]OEF73803.1 hypothetical protein A148_02780 [Vibrio splendidus 1F-157]
MRAGMEEKQMRDVKEQIRVNEIRDAKGKNKEGDSLVFRSSLLVYPHPASAFKLFATRIPVSRICSYLLLSAFQITIFIFSPLGSSTSPQHIG